MEADLTLSDAPASGGDAALQPAASASSLSIMDALDADVSLSGEQSKPAESDDAKDTAGASAQETPPAALKPAADADAAKSTDPKAAESATPNGEPETPADPVAADAPKTRGQLANERHEADKADLRAQIDAAIKERDDAAAALQATKDAEAKSRAEYARLLGPDAEFERLQRLNSKWDPYSTDPDPLTHDERANLNQWTVRRELREPFIEDGVQQGQQLAQQILGAKQAEWLEGFTTVAAELQFDPSTARDADPAGLIRHAVERVTARLTADVIEPLRTQLSQTQAELTTATDRLGAAKPTLSLGGRSGADVPNTAYDPSLSIEKNLELALHGGSS